MDGTLVALALGGWFWSGVWDVCYPLGLHGMEELACWEAQVTVCVGG